MNTRNLLLRKYHYLLRKAGVSNDEKMVLLASYGVESSKDLSVYELVDICNKLDMKTDKSAQKANLWRKRVMGAIGGYLDATGDNSNANKIIAIACRASRYDNFNAIPVDQLRSVYNAFKNRTKAIKAVETMDVNLDSVYMGMPLGEA